jgi:hypothetical protein
MLKGYGKGTGKSVLLQEIIRTLREKHSKSVTVTASTGEIVFLSLFNRLLMYMYILFLDDRYRCL